MLQGKNDGDSHSTSQCNTTKKKRISLAKPENDFNVAKMTEAFDKIAQLNEKCSGISGLSFKSIIWRLL